MNLTSHTTTLDELNRCLRVLGPTYDSDPDLISCLPDVFRQLLHSGALACATVEDQVGSDDRTIVALGASVFVSDAFLEELLIELPPCPSAWIVRRILGSRSPVLSPESVRRANARDGVNVVILHECFVSFPLGEMPHYAFREKLAAAFFALHCGYRLKSFVQEVYGNAHLDWYLSAGLKLRRDYAEYFAARGKDQSRAEQHPYLVGLTRQEAEEAPGARSYTMFIHTPARFAFTLKEQDLLRRALEGETDEELAQSLDLSLSMVKNRWDVICDRVAVTAPGLLGAKREEISFGVEGRRGAERSRHLLNYLRDHPEELLSVNAARR